MNIMSGIIVATLAAAGSMVVLPPKLDKNPAPFFVNAPKWLPKAGRYLAKQNQVIRVAVLDTGIDIKEAAKANLPLCKTGHFNAVTNTEELPADVEGHGTVMAKAIAHAAEGANICLIIIGFFPPIPGDIQKYELRGLKHALKAGANIVSMSFRGPGFEPAERDMLKKLSNNKVMMLAAAGNESFDLNKACIAYPACYTGIPYLFSVGAKDSDETPTKYTNYGSMIKVWEYGTFENSMGTSVSTALAAGRMAKFWSDTINGK